MATEAMPCLLTSMKHGSRIRRCASLVDKGGRAFPTKVLPPLKFHRGQWKTEASTRPSLVASSDCDGTDLASSTQVHSSRESSPAGSTATKTQSIRHKPTRLLHDTDTITGDLNDTTVMLAVTSVRDSTELRSGLRRTRSTGALQASPELRRLGQRRCMGSSGAGSSAAGGRSPSVASRSSVGSSFGATGGATACSPSAASSSLLGSPGSSNSPSSASPTKERAHGNPRRRKSLSLRISEPAGPPATAVAAVPCAGAPAGVSPPGRVRGGSGKPNPTLAWATGCKEEQGSSSSNVIAPITGSNWIRGRHLGQGSYGTVCRAVERSTGRIFAVKSTTVDADGRTVRALEQELHICQELRHPNIISYLGHEHLGSELCIFLEYAAGGSVAAMLSEFGPLEDHLLRKAISGLLAGLAYLHDHKPCIVHRDIKGANLLMDLDFNTKLADFGCSKCAFVSHSFTMVGSVPWMAPEVMQQQSGYGRKADIWSVGCTIIEMVTAEKPWGKGAFDNLMAAIMHIGLTDTTPPIPENATADCRSLIQACVQRQPENRPQAAELLGHGLLAGEG